MMIPAALYREIFHATLRVSAVGRLLLVNGGFLWLGFGDLFREQG
jgi:hypothetical protein